MSQFYTTKLKCILLPYWLKTWRACPDWKVPIMFLIYCSVYKMFENCPRWHLQMSCFVPKRPKPRDIKFTMTKSLKISREALRKCLSQKNDENKVCLRGRVSSVVEQWWITEVDSSTQKYVSLSGLFLTSKSAFVLCAYHSHFDKTIVVPEKRVEKKHVLSLLNLS